MNIMFVCTGNTCRSPMAEVIARGIFAKKGIKADFISRGLSVFPSGASENAKIAVSKMGLSLDGFESKQISIDDIKWADIILTMTDSHKAYLKEACVSLGKELYSLAEAACEYDEVSDPYGRPIEVYEACAEQIKKYIEIIAEKLV